jgi:hypothetical protein
MSALRLRYPQQRLVQPLRKTRPTSEHDLIWRSESNYGKIITRQVPIRQVMLWAWTTIKTTIETVNIADTSVAWPIHSKGTDRYDVVRRAATGLDPPRDTVGVGSADVRSAAQDGSAHLSHPRLRCEGLTSNERSNSPRADASGRLSAHTSPFRLLVSLRTAFPVLACPPRPLCYNLQVTLKIGLDGRNATW